MALFKSREQREAERRLKVRRARQRLSAQVTKLRAQREKYHALGQEAARQGRREKVKLLARSILQFHKMEKRFQDVLITLELFEAQKEMVTIQGSFVEAMKACALSIRDANVTKLMAEMETELEKATATSEEAQMQLDDFLESGADSLVQGAEASNDELASLERDMLQGAQEQEKGAVPDRIDADIDAIQQELKKEI